MVKKSISFSVAFDNDIDFEKLYTILDLSLVDPQTPPVNVNGMVAGQILTSKIWQV